ncbi:hypothetical protein PG993_003097 [Apiospora rasikravindrae]|uniref:Uncharacterized protein n=1 Tax=Apiospora rasikravindrae TaxID=990691 RepID=A0ABR1TYZ7_9PEZI
MIGVFLQRQARRKRSGFGGYVESDKLATWFEYLFFTHYHCERSGVLVRLLQPTYDKAWRTLEASVKLEPFETPEYIRSGESSRERYAARWREERNLAAAVLQWGDLRFPQAEEAEEEAPQSPVRSWAEHQQQVAKAEEQVKQAQESLEALWERGQHLEKFMQAAEGYEGRRTEHERLDRQLQWVFGQVAQVEFERDQLHCATTHSLKSESSAKRVSRTDNGDDGDTIRARPKRPRLDAQTYSVPYEPPLPWRR